jgi:hypothetical protein
MRALPSRGICRYHNQPSNDAKLVYWNSCRLPADVGASLRDRRTPRFCEHFGGKVIAEREDVG